MSHQLTFDLRHKYSSSAIVDYDEEIYLSPYEEQI